MRAAHTHLHVRMCIPYPTTESCIVALYTAAAILLMIFTLILALRCASLVQWLLYATVIPPNQQQTGNVVSHDYINRYRRHHAMSRAATMVKNLTVQKWPWPVNICPLPIDHRFTQQLGRMRTSWSQTESAFDCILNTIAAQAGHSAYWSDPPWNLALWAC